MPADVLAGMSPNTRRVYERAWQAFESWCTVHNVASLPADEATVLNYIGYLAEETACAPSSARVTVAAIQRVHRLHHQPALWAGSEYVRLLLGALAQQRRDDGFVVKHAAALSAVEAESLLAAADDDGVRSSALISLMLYTGARIGELLAAKVSDVSRTGDSVFLQIPGPGRKGRVVPLVPAAAARLDRYVCLSGLGEGDPLFATSTGRQLDPKQVRRVLLRCAKRARLDPRTVEQITPHSARATFATSNLAAGASLREVQHALGHEDPRTTETYGRSVTEPEQHPASRMAGLVRSPELDGKKRPVLGLAERVAREGQYL